ncbi:MAG: phosphate acetyltransferase [Candidatus Marinimicrobia bacterium]|nr:phosphate acetyltransferase [Candidatus Neomarinimicrobiota bacterium]
MLKILKDLRERAIDETNVHLLLPEAKDERIIKAAAEISKLNIAKVTLLGNEDEIKNAKNTKGISLDKVNFIIPEKSNDFNDYVNTYMELRKKKGIQKEEAVETIKDPTFFAAMMLKNNLADICISGAMNPTSHVLKAGLRIVKMEEGISTMSSDIFMFSPDESRIFSFADCAVVPDPTSENLAEMAYITAKTHKSVFNVEPVVAMLSFSTKGSGKHPLVEKVEKAVEIAKEKYPDLNVDGELQADAAIVDAIGKKKAPGSKVAGKANVLIFPDLNSANIGYKLVQRLGGYEAVGPILQGLNKPMHDLSRGCSVDDIINLTVIAALQSQ